MSAYRKFRPADVMAMADSLRGQLDNGLLPDEVLERFKFRGDDNDTWTVNPRDRRWYRFQAGAWTPVNPSEGALDGEFELLSLATLPPSPAQTRRPEENPPTAQNLDVGQVIERATGRIREAYQRGEINSDEAESLLADLYLLDPVAGAIWSCGMHTQRWYQFRQNEWEASTAAPDPQHFRPVTPENCSYCGSPLQGGEVCPNCGAPTAQPGGGFSRAAREVVLRFVESGAEALPERVVPAWNPAPGFPAKSGAASVPFTAAAPAGAAVAGPAQPRGTVDQATMVTPRPMMWNLRLVQGPGTGQTYPLGMLTRIGRAAENEIILTDEQSSRHHAVIKQQDDAYVIRDQGSTNGTFVNSARIQAVTRLNPGDRISIGDTHFLVEGSELQAAETRLQRTPGVVISAAPAREEAHPAQKKRRRWWLGCLGVVFLASCCLTLLAISYYLYDSGVF